MLIVVIDFIVFLFILCIIGAGFICRSKSPVTFFVIFVQQMNSIYEKLFVNMHCAFVGQIR